MRRNFSQKFWKIGEKLQLQNTCNMPGKLSTFLQSLWYSYNIAGTSDFDRRKKLGGPCAAINLIFHTRELCSHLNSFLISILNSHVLYAINFSGTNSTNFGKNCRE